MLRYIIIVFVSVLFAVLMYYKPIPTIRSWRKVMMIFLRSIVYACLGLLLLSPIIYYLNHIHKRPIIVFLKDKSDSMKLNCGSQSKQKALDEKADLLQEIYEKSGYRCQSIDFADGIDGNHNATFLGKTIVQAYEKYNLADASAVVLVSDGWFRDEDYTSVSNVNIPVYALVDTTSYLEPDIAVIGLQNEKHGYRNEPTLFRADIKSTRYKGQADVVLKINGKAVAKQTARLNDTQMTTVDFVHKFTQNGNYQVAIEVQNPTVHEKNTSNNSFPGMISILNDREKIIVLSDSPDWDNKFIIDALKENPRWDISSYIIKNSEMYRGNQIKTAIDWNGCVALAVVNNWKLTIPQTIVRSIIQMTDKGLGLFYQGKPISELSSILPVQISNVQASFQGLLDWKPEGNAYPMFMMTEEDMNSIPPVDYYYIQAREGALISAVINNPQHSPAVVLDEQHQRSIVFAFNNLWKWQLQSSSNAYRNMLIKVFTWLSNRMAENYNAICQSSYFLGDEIKIKLNVEDDIRQIRIDLSPKITIKNADNQTMFSDFLTYSDGVYSIVPKLDKPGIYSFTITDNKTDRKTAGVFIIQSACQEQRDINYNLNLLNWITSKTKGRIISLSDASNYNPPPVKEDIKTIRNEFPIYKKWYLIALFMLAFSIELFLRRRWGML